MLISEENIAFSNKRKTERSRAITGSPSSCVFIAIRSFIQQVWLHHAKDRISSFPFFFRPKRMLYLIIQNDRLVLSKLCTLRARNGVNFLFSLFLVEHTDLRGKLSAKICLQILTRLPQGGKEVINLSF